MVPFRPKSLSLSISRKNSRHILELLQLARASQCTSRFRSRMLAVFDHLDAVYENVFHATRVLMWLFECRVVGDRRRIEDDRVGEHSFFHHSATIESEIGRGQSAQSSYRFRQR